MKKIEVKKDLSLLIPNAEKKEMYIYRERKKLMTDWNAGALSRAYYRLAVCNSNCIVIVSW